MPHRSSRGGGGGEDVCVRVKTGWNQVVLAASLSLPSASKTLNLIILSLSFMSALVMVFSQFFGALGNCRCMIININM